MPVAGILGWKRSKLEIYSAQLQKSWNSTKVIFGKYKKYPTEEVHQRGPHLSTRVGARPLPCGPPVGPPVPIFCYMKSFVRRKIIRKLSGRDSTATRRNLGGTNLGLWLSCSAEDTSLREREIITNDPLIERGSISINIFTSTISSQTLVHLLSPILVSKSEIGTCRLLVVLITPCSWC